MLRDIEAVLQAYFDGFHDGDRSTLETIFHEECRLCSPVDGQVRTETRNAWLERVATRPSARSQGLDRHDRIVTIDMSSTSTAFAKVECAMPPRYFVDYLTLVHTAGQGWLIVSKTFCVRETGI